jgi:hypothetical protein
MATEYRIVKNYPNSELEALRRTMPLSKTDIEEVAYVELRFWRKEYELNEWVGPNHVSVWLEKREVTDWEAVDA